MKRLLMSGLVLISAFAANSVFSQEKIPTLFPSNTTYRFMLMRGELRPLLSSSPDPREVWNDPTAHYFFQKSTWKELDFTDDQIKQIEKMQKERVEFNKFLGRRSNLFANEARDENGKIDMVKYRKLIKKNFDALVKFNEQQELKLREVVPRHQWVQMSEIITKYTLKGEGLASQITKAGFSDFLDLTDAQKEKLKTVSRKLIEENKKQMKKMSQKTVRELMQVLTKDQKQKLLKAIGAEDFSEFESINIVALNEQLRRFVDADKSAQNPKSGKQPTKKR